MCKIETKQTHTTKNKEDIMDKKQKNNWIKKKNLFPIKHQIEMFLDF